jgi:hypothetical protein
MELLCTFVHSQFACSWAPRSAVDGCGCPSVPSLLLQGWTPGGVSLSSYPFQCELQDEFVYVYEMSSGDFNWFNMKPHHFGGELVSIGISSL